MASAFFGRIVIPGHAHRKPGIYGASLNRMYGFLFSAMDPGSAQHHFVLQRVQDDGGEGGSFISTVILNLFQDP